MSKKELFRRNTAMMALAGLMLLIGLSAGQPAISQENNFQDSENCADSAYSSQNDSTIQIADDNVPIEGQENKPQSLDKISTESIGAAPPSAILLSPPDNEILSSGNVP